MSAADWVAFGAAAIIGGTAGFVGSRLWDRWRETR